MQPRTKIIEASWADEFERKINETVDGLMKSGYGLSGVSCEVIAMPNSTNTYFAIVNYVIPDPGEKIVNGTDEEIDDEDERVNTGLKDDYDRGFMDGAYSVMKMHERH